MRNETLTLALIFFGGFGFLKSQITITRDYFPRSGDTLYTSIDNLPTNIDLKTPGENISWDFSQLQSPFIQKTVFYAPAPDLVPEVFSSATVATSEDPGSAWFKASENSFDLLGYSGADPLDFGLESNLVYSPPLPERYAPLSYGDIHELTTKAVLPFSIDQLPNEILEQLPITPDSLRIRIQINRFSEVDAHGSVLLPDGVNYPVLREKRVESLSIGLDAKLGPLPWQDITGLFPGNDMLPALTTTSYYFFNNNSKEPIAIVQTDPEEEATAINVIYKATDMTTPVRPSVKNKPELIAFPNPAIANVRFEFNNSPAGKYQLKVYNILVQEVLSKEYYIEGPQTVQVDISQLRKGTYLYTLIDEKGKTLGTKRLIVLRP